MLKEIYSRPIRYLRFGMDICTLYIYIFGSGERIRIRIRKCHNEYCGIYARIYNAHCFAMFTRATTTSSSHPHKSSTFLNIPPIFFACKCTRIHFLPRFRSAFMHIESRVRPLCVPVHLRLRAFCLHLHTPVCRETADGVHFKRMHSVYVCIPRAAKANWQILEYITVIYLRPNAETANTQQNTHESERERERETIA